MANEALGLLGLTCYSQKRQDCHYANNNSELTYNTPKKNPYEKSCLNIIQMILTPAMTLPLIVPVTFEVPILFL